MSTQAMAWIGFNVFVLAMLILDAAVFHRKAHEVKFKEALLWSGFWISLALLFNVGIYYFKGKEAALQFLAGYLIEESLSIDNLFVFLLIFSYFKVPHLYQHKILFWGILGAQVMRAVFIFAGVALIHKFHWIIYIFGAFLMFSGFKLFFEKDKKVSPEKNIVLRGFKKFFPVTHDYHDGKFFVKETGKWTATPLFVVLLVIETTDLVFAVDSIPAILAITKDPFIVYTSNIFAILGLRALYFALAELMKLFHNLHYGLGVILVFVGIKMLLESVMEIPIVAALGFIVMTLIASVISSIIFPAKKTGSIT